MSRNIISRYLGPPSRVEKKVASMTDAEVEKLRAKVPDDPVKLPAGHLACEACGVAVPEAVVVSTVAGPSRGKRAVGSLQFARCAECKKAREVAEKYLIERPVLAARLGPELARERVETVLHALTVLEREPGPDLGLLLPRLVSAAAGMWFSSPLALTTGLCSPYPWAHVGTGQRAELRKAYAAVLADRLALSAPPVHIPCPTLGCVFCGVASVKRAAIDVARFGGIEAASRAVWREVNTRPSALGVKGPEPVWGHACPDCAHAIEQRGAIGFPARAQALVSFVARSSIKKAERLRREVEGDFPPTLPGWGALNLRPNSEPWAHLNKVIDRL